MKIVKEDKKCKYIHILVYLFFLCISRIKILYILLYLKVEFLSRVSVSIFTSKSNIYYLLELILAFLIFVLNLYIYLTCRYYIQVIWAELEYTVIWKLMPKLNFLIHFVFRHHKLFLILFTIVCVLAHLTKRLMLAFLIRVCPAYLSIYLSVC